MPSLVFPRHTVASHHTLPRPVAGLIVLVLIAMLWTASPLLLGPDSPLTRLRIVLVALVLIAVTYWVGLGLQSRAQPAALPVVMLIEPTIALVPGLLPVEALQLVCADMADARPYIENMCQQIDGVKTDVESGVMGVITQAAAMNVESLDQMERIRKSVESGRTLTDATASLSRIVVELEGQLSSRLIELQTNSARIDGISAEVGSLRPMVAAISKIADHTNLLSVNAMIEAVRAGAAGTAFEVVAAGVRKLSEQTTTVAAEVATRINSAADKIAIETSRTARDGERAAQDLRLLILQLSPMNEQLSNGSRSLLDVIQGVEQGHHEMIVRLSHVLGHVQFQDVMRQRLDQVQDAMQEMGAHLEDLTTSAIDRDWDGQMDASLYSRLAGHRNTYVMASQVSAHDTALGRAEPVATQAAAPAIQLF